MAQITNYSSKGDEQKHSEEIPGPKPDPAGQTSNSIALCPMSKGLDGPALQDFMPATYFSFLGQFPSLYGVRFAYSIPRLRYL